MLSFIKVFIVKDNIRDYKGARVKRIIITLIKYICADGRYLNPIII